MILMFLNYFFFLYIRCLCCFIILAAVLFLQRAYHSHLLLDIRRAYPKQGYLLDGRCLYRLF